MRAFRAWLFLGLISACSNSNPADDAGADASNDVTSGKDVANDATQGSDATVDAPVDSPVVDAPVDSPKDAPADVKSDASDAGLQYTLTINDYLNWCAVSVNGGQSSTQDPQTFQFAPDASVALHGDTANASFFYWGYWQSKDLGDGGQVLNKDVNITMNGDVTILACCPDNNTPLSCP